MAQKEISIKGFIARRILFAIVGFFGIITLMFILIHQAPGSAIDMFLGESGADPAYIQYVTAKFGLDRPLYEQFITYVGSILRGDLGYSLYFRMGVLPLILERIPLTFLLVGTSSIISSSLGILLGVVASKNVYSKTDNIVSSLGVIGVCFPAFFLGQILLIVFSVQLGLLPLSGAVSLTGKLTGWAYAVDLLSHLILPALTLGIVQLALVFRVSRASMLETLSKDFILTARAKGLTERTILFKHALKNAMISISTVTALNLGRIIGGAVLTETVFGWPGLGRLMWQSVSVRDYPVVLGIVIFITTGIILINICLDIVYAVIDPRVTFR